jgi:ribosomal protein S18 acetylase RimI-like enzyme
LADPVLQFKTAHIHPAMSGLTLRPLRPGDADAVAALHATSWRSAYRGILSDAYLKEAVDADHASTWHVRLGEPRDDAFGKTAVRDGALVGFVYVTQVSDVRWGVLIDNLHVAPGARSAGIGPRLLDAAARGIDARGWGRRVHLWVHDANVRARRFYARVGGVEVEQVLKLAPDGQSLPEWRVAWTDAAVLSHPALPSC